MVAGVKNGSNLEMPGAGLDSARELLKGVKGGRISEREINERVDELLGLIFAAYEKVAQAGGSADDHNQAANAALAKKLGKQEQTHAALSSKAKAGEQVPEAGQTPENGKAPEAGKAPEVSQTSGAGQTREVGQIPAASQTQGKEVGV